MSRPRRLTSEDEEVIKAWYSEYSKTLERLRKLPSTHDIAHRFKISIRTLYDVVKRDKYTMTRKLRDTRAPSLLLGVKNQNLQR